MTSKTVSLIVVGATLAFIGTVSVGSTCAAPAAPAASATQDGRGTVYGWELMTPQERQQFRDRMRNTTTAQEREKIRAEHHKEMQERARERGVTLPEMPPQRGMGQGKGAGMGPGPGGRGGPGGN